MNNHAAQLPSPEPARPSSPVPSTPSISVVLSFRNEEACIPELITRLRAVFAAERKAGHIARHELIFVNDASTDDSEMILRAHAVGNDDIRIINMSRNFGVSPCVLAGMEYSTSDLVVYMDADLQDPPELIPELIRVWKSEPDVGVVHTVRTDRAGESWLKLAITRMGYRILHMSSTIKLPIEAGDYKLLSREVVEHLVELREKRPFLRGLVCWIGFKQMWVNYEREARFGGATKFPVLSYKVIGNFLESALISFSDAPLRLATLAGSVAALLALSHIIWVLIEKYRGHNLPGWSATMTAVLFLGGTQLLCTGLQGLYISSIFQECKRRPNYIVKDTFGFAHRAEAKESERSQRRPPEGRET
jgi:glycosyltransferase involved in cell wall biosynthesis